MTSAEPHERVLTILRRHGWNATSFQALEPDCKYWFADDEACVAYADTGSAWVAAAAPLAPTERLHEVAAGFVQAARREGKRVSFFGTESRFVQATGWPSLKLGEQPVWDPRAWAETLAGARSLREQLRRARARGVTVAVLEGAALEAPGMEELRALAERWQASRGMASMGFLVDLQPLLHREEKRYLLAMREGQVVEALVMAPVYARPGWLLEDLLHTPAAPNGCSELLIDAAMRFAAAQGASFVSLGMVPLAGVQGWMRFVGKHTRWLYDFSGLQAFRARLRPGRWDPVFLTTPPGASPTLALLEALRAFARGSLVRFGLATLRHRLHRPRALPASIDAE